MDNPAEKSEVPSLLVLVWPVVEYLLEWPFMCHAGLVLLVAWIASYLHFNVALVCTLGFLYLYQVKLLHPFQFFVQVVSTSVEYIACLGRARLSSGFQGRDT